MRAVLWTVLIAVGTLGTTQPGSQRIDSRQLVVTISTSAATVTPGTRVSLLLDVTPKPGMHVYGPEQKDYIPISISLELDDAIKAVPPVFPKAEKVLFAPLNETQLVFTKPFRIVQDVTVKATPAVRQRAAATAASLTLKGSLRYQACDDKVCYVPQTVPLSWTVGLKPLER
jgi:DsbC/DsbD-like thiol-disulfide interchange protein